MKRLASSIVLAVCFAACQLGAAPSFGVRVPSPREGIPALDVVVVDRAGVVAGVESRDPVDWKEGIGRSDRPDQVIVSWLGGLCDVRTTLSVTSNAGTLTINETTETTGGACRLAGISRSVALDLDREIDPETIWFVSEDGS